MPVYHCDICKKKFPRKENVKRHLETHVSENARKKFQCQLCQILFTQKCNLVSHHKLKHHGSELIIEKRIPQSAPCKKEFYCVVCEKSFTRKENLQNHQKIHTGGQSSKEQCSICNRSFSTKSNLKKHVKQVHHQKVIEIAEHAHNKIFVFFF